MVRFADGAEVTFHVHCAAHAEDAGAFFTEALNPPTLTEEFVHVLSRPPGVTITFIPPELLEELDELPVFSAFELGSSAIFGFERISFGRVVAAIAL
jgi:hypothetical protein